MDRAPLVIGTLSFAKHGPRMVLPPARRVEIILGCIQLYRPSLLVTAGYALDTVHELADLSNCIARLNRSLAVVVEVHHETTVGEGDHSKHALWMIGPNPRALHRFGSQAFGRAEEAPDDQCEAATKLRVQLSERTAEVFGHRIFGLICGELNIVQGRHHPKFICREIRAAMMGADIIVNPTHDRMGNGGTLRAKRAMLSKPYRDKDRLYVSCSNWDVSGIDRDRQQPSPTLHTVYHSGEPMDFDELSDGQDGFVYRRWAVDL